jgi:predicted AAA+ superfamily ATPase
MFERNILKRILPFLNTDDVIVIHGARQTGKTTLLKIIMESLPSGSAYYLDLEDGRLKTVCDEGPESLTGFLRQKGVLGNQKKFYVLIDEIQYLSNPSSLLKIIHDHYPQLKLIVSGSSSFDIKSKFKDSLVGRTADFVLYPLDFEEFTRFKGRNYDFGAPITAGAVLAELAALYREYALYGGYPKITLTDSIDIKETYLQQIIDTYIKNDIRDLANIKHIEKFNKLIRILASQSGKLFNVRELSATAQLAQQTVEEYLFILESTYVIRRLRPYSRNIRSELFKMPKVFFYDTGIMNMLQFHGLPAEITGAGFETSVFSELVKTAGAENIFFWRTQDKKEIDFIVTSGQEVRPVEVKLNAAAFNATALNYFNGKYSPPSCFCVTLEGIPAAKASFVRNVRPWERSYKHP